MKIDYRGFDDFPGWLGAPAFLKNFIEKHSIKAVFEVGSGANPTLEPDYIREKSLAYTTNDISQEELDKADPVFRTCCVDLCDKKAVQKIGERFELIFSRMVNEHVRNGRTYFQNLHQLLEPGGLTVHCFSTLYTLPFVVNWLIPETVTGALLNSFAPRDRFQHEKFKAYYSWSRGPTSRMISNFHGVDFEVLEYVGFFGHAYYRTKLSLLDRLERWKAALLVKHPNPYLTSYAYVVLRKR